MGEAAPELPVPSVVSAACSLVWRVAEQRPGTGCGAAPLRMGVFTCATVDRHAVLERCSARALPAWQGGSDFIWSRGAFGLPAESAREDREAVLPFGWGMLYADASIAGVPANVHWLIEDDVAAERAEVPEDEERDETLGRPCWLLLTAGRALSAGEELIVDRRWPEAMDARGLDLCSLAISELEPGELKRRAPDGAALPPTLPPPPRDGVEHPAAGKVQLHSSEKHGLGAFAARAFAKGEVIEVAPAVVVSDNEVPTYGGTLGQFSHAYSDYTFDACLVKTRLCVLALGFGPLYNHSSRPNCQQRWAYAEAEGSACEEPCAQHFCYAFAALRDIAEGEELLHDYGTAYWDARGKWPL